MLQVSVVHEFPSLHWLFEVHCGVCWQHPLLQVSVVHESPSLHWLFDVHWGVLRQKPLLHVSVVQALPSLHCELDVQATQTPLTQDCPAGHVMGVF